MIKVRVKNRIITCKKELVEDNVDTFLLDFDLDQMWDGFNKRITFYNDSIEASDINPIDIPFTNPCKVPWEVLTSSGNLYLTLTGTKDDTSEVIRTQLMSSSIKINMSGLSEGGPGADPTPDIIASITQTAEEAVTIAQSVRDDADAGKFNGKDALINGKNTLNIVPGTNVSFETVDEDTLKINSGEKWETIIDNQELTDVSEIDLKSFFTKPYKKIILVLEGNGSKATDVAGFLCLNNEINTDSGCSINIYDCNKDYPYYRSAERRTYMLSLGYKSNYLQRTTIIINCEGGICRTEWLKSTDAEDSINSVDCNPLVGISPYNYIDDIFIVVDDGGATFTGTLAMRGVEYID